MGLGESIRGIIRKFTGGVADETSIKELIKELQRTLISNDVNVKLVLTFSKALEEKCLIKRHEGLGFKEFVVSTVYEELVKILGEKYTPEIKPKKILLCGLYGSGKTTSCSKIAKYYSSRGLKVLLIPGDVHRPAAFEQLKQISEQVNVSFFDVRAKTVKELMKALKEHRGKEEVLIFDTAGRSAFDQELADELKFIDDEFKPDEKILVVSGDIGQVAFKQATEFKNVLHNVTGVIATKMDGSAKGGGVLSAVAASGSRILFLGTGEKPEDLTAYDPKKFVSNLLGFPDFETLLEKAKEINVTKELPQKLTYAAFIEQLKAMKKMGSLKSIMQMMGVYDVPEELVGKSEEKLKAFENAYNSMTEMERNETDLMKEKSRQERVAKGAGLKVEEVKEMVTNFEKISKMMKGLEKNRGLMSKLRKNPQFEKMFKDGAGNV